MSWPRNGQAEVILLACWQKKLNTCRWHLFYAWKFTKLFLQHDFSKFAVLWSHCFLVNGTHVFTKLTLLLWPLSQMELYTFAIPKLQNTMFTTYTLFATANSSLLQLWGTKYLWTRWPSHWASLVFIRHCRQKPPTVQDSRPRRRWRVLDNTDASYSLWLSSHAMKASQQSSQSSARNTFRMIRASTQNSEAIFVPKDQMRPCTWAGAARHGGQKGFSQLSQFSLSSSLPPSLCRVYFPLSKQ